MNAPDDGWKRSGDDPRRVAVTFSVSTAVATAFIAALVGLISDVRITTDASDTRLKECSQQYQEMRFGRVMQARMDYLTIRRNPEKPTTTLEGAGE